MGAFRAVGTQCCGIVELADISALPTPEEVVWRTARLLADRTDDFHTCPAWLMFSGVVGQRQRVYPTFNHADRDDNYGQALADYILANDLGSVTETPLSKNHNGNMLRVWLWAPKWEALKKIHEQHQSSKGVSGNVSLTISGPAVDPRYTITPDNPFQQP